MDEKSIAEEYKEKIADKFSLGMAINNAAIMSAGSGKAFSKNEMKALIKGLFELYKELRKEELGY